MKTTVIFLFFIISTLVYFGCTSKQTKVREHAEAINYQHQRVVNRLDALERSLESYVPDLMDKTWSEALQQLDSAELAVRGLRPVSPESDLRAEALLLFDTYRLLLNNDYPEIIERQKKPAGSFTIADQFLVENLGRLIASNRQRAKQRYEREAATVLESWDVPFKPVIAEVDEVTPSRMPESAE
jgi:hypothetical protein